MQVCGNCGHRNRPGVVFCDNCGTSLIGDSPLNTKQYKQDQAAEANAALDNAVHSAGSETFGKGTILRIEIGDSEPVLLKPKAETVFGRRDAATGSMPDVDLTPFAGYRMGVSRKHAIIKQSDEQDRLDLVDLGSSNGTFLNGARLNANKPYKLRDGDEMRLGQMIIHIYFQHNLGEQPPRPQSAQVGGINLTPPGGNDNGLSGEDGGKTNPVSPPDSPKTS